MQKAADALRTIGEVARLIGVQPHVLRYWETQFPQLNPVKRPDGRRYYRLDDLYLAAGLVELLREEGMTTRGAQRQLARDKGAALRERGRARLPAGFGSAPQGTDGPASKAQKTQPAGTEAASPEAEILAADDAAGTPEIDPAPPEPLTVSRPEVAVGQAGIAEDEAPLSDPPMGGHEEAIAIEAEAPPYAALPETVIEALAVMDTAAHLARLRTLALRLRAQPPQGLMQAARQRDALAAFLSSRD